MGPDPDSYPTPHPRSNPLFREQGEQSVPISSSRKRSISSPLVPRTRQHRGAQHSLAPHSKLSLEHLITVVTAVLCSQLTDNHSRWCVMSPLTLHVNKATNKRPDFMSYTCACSIFTHDASSWLSLHHKSVCSWPNVEIFHFLLSDDCPSAFVQSFYLVVVLSFNIHFIK